MFTVIKLYASSKLKMSNSKIWGNIVYFSQIFKFGGPKNRLHDVIFYVKCGQWCVWRKRGYSFPLLSQTKSFFFLYITFSHFSHQIVTVDNMFFQCFLPALCNVSSNKKTSLILFFLLRSFSYQKGSPEKWNTYKIKTSWKMMIRIRLLLCFYQLM